MRVASVALLTTKANCECGQRRRRLTILCIWVREGLAIWVGSEVLHVEVSRNPDRDQRRGAEALLLFANEVVILERADADRARQIAKLGFSPFDALHLACAERGAAEVFLTTDDNLLRRAQRNLRNLALLHIRVENPVSWYEATQS